MFEHDKSFCANLLPIYFPTSYENGKLEHFLHQWTKNHEHNNLCTTEVAIDTNLCTDLYASIGTGSSRTGGYSKRISCIGIEKVLWNS
ncbi:hypothetical protein M9H77_36265 [Catharanthus roseus]|uniref:Uncharacterized protein n=1 Tax=Catharanthus roseus TaxID=4058 RepID=A0ACB9ZV18_CATRO|nr:hypothetical protein M9H77_36265 [Catharanthus roseus]